MPLLIPPSSPALRAMLCSAAIAQLGLAGSLAQADSQSPSYRDHGTHVHGVGWLNVAVDGDRLFIELISPAMDLIGFEHQPRNAKQRAELDAAHARLKQPETLFAPNAEAGCTLTTSEIDLGFDTQRDGGGTDGKTLNPAQGHEHEHEHEHADEHGNESHADVYASYVFECQQPLKLDAISIGFFQAFSRAQKLQAQLITEIRQEAVTLTRTDRRLVF